MYQVLEAKILPALNRIGIVKVKYYDMVFICDICVYKKSHIWLRMPEYWPNPNHKKKALSWESKQVSDRFQESVLNRVFDMLELDLSKALQIRKDFFNRKKTLTKQKGKSILGKKKSEI